MNKSTKNIISFYENLTPKTINDISFHYASECLFKDPFNTFTTRKDLTSLYEKMFEKLKSPKFTISNYFEKDNEVILFWDFKFNNGFTIHGNSHLILDKEQKIVSHIDYWDSVNEIWLKIPILKLFIRFFYSFLKYFFGTCFVVDITI
jgi:hypothetical protein